MRWLAPGKVVIAGEYAVLDGAPAIVAAVDRGVVCTVRESSAQGVRELTVPKDDRFVRAALNAVNAPPLHYTFDAYNPVTETPHKVGLGSSAAAVVVAVLAGQGAAGSIADNDARFLLARRVHRAVQGGGSGIDVAASTYGGVLRFVDGHASPMTLLVHPVVVFTGTPAATGPRVQQYLAWTGRDAFVARSAATVAAFADDPVAAIADAAVGLRLLQDAAGIDIFTPALDRIAQIAMAHGGASKPSGAGGGDIAVALFRSQDAGEAFARACREEGLLPVSLQITKGAGRLDG